MPIPALQFQKFSSRIHPKAWSKEKIQLGNTLPGLGSQWQRNRLTSNSYSQRIENKPLPIRPLNSYWEQEFQLSKHIMSNRINQQVLARRRETGSIEGQKTSRSCIHPPGFHAQAELCYCGNIPGHCQSVCPSLPAVTSQADSNCPRGCFTSIIFLIFTSYSLSKVPGLFSSRSASSTACSFSIKTP